MRFIKSVIYFGIYAVFVLILTSIYVVFFEKTVKAKMHKSENLEREKVRNTRIGPEDLRGVLVRRRWSRERGTERREEERQHGTDLRLGARQGVSDDVHGPGPPSTAVSPYLR